MSAPTTLAQVSTAAPITLVMTAGVVPGVKASDPDPPDGATGVTTPLLGWTAGETAKWHDVYLGTNPTPGAAEYKGRQAQAWNMWYEMAGWIAGTTYYWRIDEIEEDGSTIHTGDVWSFTAGGPYTAYNPDPPDGARNVPTDTDLSWVAGLTSITHDVYFGTNRIQVANGTGGTFKGNQPDVFYDPGTLQMGSTYYWRIDEIDAEATKYTGDVWSFTAAGAVPGVKASDPDPPDGATGVTAPLLGWTAGETAKWHDVYLGTNPTPGAAEHKDRLPLAWNMWFEAGGWIPGQTYYWRIDEVEEDGTTIHTGDVWSFTAAPYTAYNPDPPNGANNVPTDADLSWTAGFDAITHDVYFGTDYADVAAGTGGTFKDNQPVTMYDPGTLQMGSTYYWRIDEIEADGTTMHTGDVWSFTAAGAVPGVKASDPNPPDGAAGVTSPLLQWTAGETAKWHDVYLGTNPTPGAAEYKARQPQAWNMWFEAAGWIAGETYYWRIDEIQEDGTTIHTGDVWSFKTIMPVELEIMGPDELVEESSAQYNAIVRYEDNSTNDVTAPATWSLDPPGYASIDENGLLTSAHVDAATIVTIYAEYTEGEVTVNAEKAVWCVPSEGKIYHVDALNGDDNNDGLSPETAFATIQTAIDSAEDVSPPPPRRGSTPAEPTTITVLVYPGVYAEVINFKGKAITLASAQDAAILEAPGDYAVSFYSGEGRTSVLKNFVIRDSYLGIFIAGSSPTISNVTVVNNEFGIAAYADADPDISSSIFWYNADGDLSGCQARYSCIQEVSQSEGNISIDPLFADPDNRDYHLLSRRGRYVPAHGLWSFDDVTSPCVDAGDPAVDPSNERTPNSGRINMGAYGGTAYASLSEWPIASDLNRDGVVDLADLNIFSQQWLMELPSGGVVPEDDPPVSNPAQWDPDGEPQEVFGGGGPFDYWVEMRAMEAADASGWVEYFFECTTDSGFSSGWQRLPEYRVLVGRQGQALRFRVKARDLYGNETAWSEELQATTPR